MVEIKKFTIFCCVVAASLVECAVTKKCCPDSPGCTYNGKWFDEGETLRVNSCESCSCLCAKPICATLWCPKPREGCVSAPTDTDCCNVNCTGCHYNSRTYIPEGGVKLVAPCQNAHCIDEKVEIATEDCPPAPEGCGYEPTLDECCNMTCDGCTYNGIYIPLNQARVVSPCELAHCFENNEVEIVDLTVTCPPAPQNCRFMPTMEECCNVVCDDADA